MASRQDRGHDMQERLETDRHARTPRHEIVPRAPHVPTAAQRPAERLLALQRGVGNRAVGSILARRVIGNDPASRIVRFTVGVELTTHKPASAVPVLGPAVPPAAEFGKYCRLPRTRWATHTTHPSERALIRSE